MLCINGDEIKEKPDDAFVKLKQWTHNKTEI